MAELPSPATAEPAVTVADTPTAVFEAPTLTRALIDAATWLHLREEQLALQALSFEDGDPATVRLHLAVKPGPDGKPVRLPGTWW
ncbi:hypothetical protein PV350_04620 [Streptomyces sp. PA03-6a]|nr:hypothetical protein [Streptomyces sp. PA03-6a]